MKRGGSNEDTTRKNDFNYVIPVNGYASSNANIQRADVDPMSYVLVKSGKFVNCLARVTSKGTTNNRYNLQVLTDYGIPIRRDDNALKSTSLVRSGFDVLVVPYTVDADGYREVDMADVTAELFRRREELNLPDFTPGVVSKRSNASIPSSALVGSPMTKSKLKIKGSTQDDVDGNSAEGDGAESRNNLYWADCKDAFTDGKTVGYACVWYGGAAISPTDSIAVLPIAPSLYTQTSGDADAACGPTPENLQRLFEVSVNASGAGSALRESNVAAVRGGTKEGTGTVSGSESGATTADEFPPLLNVSEKLLRHHQRADLTPLDDELVNAKYAEEGEDNLHRHFLIALLEFAEWDYPQRDSYIWPDFVVGLMQSPELQMEYLRTARQHPLNNGARPLSDVILFLLCAEHSGLLDEWDDERFLAEAVCTDSLCSLLENIIDFKRTGEEIFRSVCRVADCFQTDMTSLGGDASTASDGVIDLTHCQTSTVESEGTGEAPAYTPEASKGKETVMEAYLEDVQRLREKHLRVNQLIEAPLDLDAFVREWTEFTAVTTPMLPTSGTASAPMELSAARQAVDSTLVTAPIHRPHRVLLDDFIAQSRRESKKLTALSTVKYIMSGEPSGGSFSVEKAFAETSAQKGIAVAVVQVTPAAPSNSAAKSSADRRKGQHSAGTEDIDRLVSSSATKNDAAQQGSAIKSGINVSMPVTNVVELVDSDSSVQPPSSAALKSPPRSASKEAERAGWVVVYYGSHELKVPIQYCRIFTVQDDQALEILHACAYDSEKALRVVSQHLLSDKTTVAASSAGVPLELTDSATSKRGRPLLAHTVTTSECDAAINRILVSPTELDHLHGIVERYHNDLQKIHRKFNRYLTKQALRMKTINSEISSTDRAVGPYFFPNDAESPSATAVQPSPVLSIWKPNADAHPDFTGEDAAETGTAEYSSRTPQDILRIYFILYPGFDDESYSIMTTFNSPLFRQWNNQQSIASAVKNYPFGGNKVIAVPPPGNKKPNGTVAANGAGPNSSSKGALTSSSKKISGNSNGFRNPTMRKNPNLPNRWPKNLPLMQHNLYWIEMSGTPCIGTGLHIKANSNDVMLNVISIHSEARRMQITPTKVIPLYEDVMKSCTDDRSVAFAAALMLFVEWELEEFVPRTSMLRKWYVYPEFVTQMLITCSKFLGWRKQADRNPRAATMSRRDNYLCALKEDYMQIAVAARNERFALCNLPWDDSPVSSGEGTGDSSDEDNDVDDDGDGDLDVDGIASIESFSDREQYERAEARRRSRKKCRKSESGNGSGGEDSEFQSALFTDQSLANPSGSNKKRSRPSDAQEKSSRSRKSSSANLPELDDEPVGVKPPAVRSLYNMFWIPRSQLPCIFYDLPENRYAERFRVIPICCVTYHYPFEVTNLTKGSVEPLKLEHLKRITDERTSEFTHALIEFARQENDMQRRAKLLSESMAQDPDSQLSGAAGMDFEGTGTEDGNETHSLFDASMLQPHELFDWPAFILELINKPSMWHSWRKKAERGGAGLKRYQYLRELHAEHRGNLELENSMKKQAEEAAVVLLPIKSELSSGPPLIRSHYNLFWLLRSNLPAIYYDTPENRYAESFRVLPINCCAYQYPMKITRSAVIIEPLSLGNLQHCTEDRTHDFTLALLDFAHWEQAERRKRTTADGDLYFISSPRAESEDSFTPAHTWGSATETDPNELYDWPAFILQMLNAPEKWSTWRKKAERSGRESRRVLYFKALLEDYRAELASKGENEMDTTS